VLSAHRISGGNLGRLVALLLGSRATLFYSLRVEEGYRWLPGEGATLAMCLTNY
jgi:hypothetical protein